MQIALPLKCSTHVRMYGFIERKSKHIGFCLVVNGHFMDKHLYSPLSTNYIQRNLVLMYRLVYVNQMATLWNVEFCASCCSNAGSISQNLY